MTIKQIFDLAVKLGIENDLRGATTVRKHLKKEVEKFKKLGREEQREFDQEKLTNPFSDTRMFVRDPHKPVKRVMAGIDIDTGEIMLAQRLGEKKPVDLVISHHPIGNALSGLHEVMHMQAEILALYGVPINVAQSLLHLRISEVSRSVSPGNHYKAVNAAALLGQDVICTHTVTDNLVATYLKKFIDRNKKRLETVGDVMKLLKTVPEYKIAMGQKAGPVLFAGNPDNFTGRIALTEITGGTESNKDLYEKISQAGIGTIIGMHMSEDHKKEAEKHHINAIIAGHMSSDSLGMNLFLDELEKKDVEVIVCSGLIRVKRFKKRR
ncbi:MAG TPA: NGG1p interacting factor NIF3 [Candidatus Kerfeldbacteria bacterium]|nr:NGG1p interacting factor NIF3 [Candidatus Kerfeldbacteria bacterium]